MKCSLLRSCLEAASAVALTLVAHSALALPTHGPSGMAFYTPPSPLPAGSHGDLIWYRPSTVGPSDPLKANAWDVLYFSTDAVGARNAVTGKVLIPTAAWNGSGPRPVVDYAVGTHGLAQSCAPSLQLSAGTDYETANIAAALNAGYAVLVTDNPGYTTGSIPSYLAGIAQGHALLDIVQAAQQIPLSPLSASAPVAVWGYSQGGQTADWAGQLQATYAPGVKLVGVAAGGVPGDFIETSLYLNGSTGASFLLGGVIGLAQQYPDGIPIASLVNPAGEVAIQKGESECVFQALFEFMNDDISMFAVNNESLQQLEAIPSVNQVLTAQNLGTTEIPVPLYQYHGQADEFIPLDQAENLKTQYCSLGSNATFVAYPGEHITTQFQAAPFVLSWIGDRFAGKSTSGTCSAASRKKPPSTAAPGGGDFIVNLDSWTLSGTVHLATLDQDVVLPSGSTFNGSTDLTSQVLTGDLSIKKFTTRLKVIGVPLTVALSINETSPISGTVTLDNAGILHIQGQVAADIVIDGAGISILRLPLHCATATPVVFPINFDGPVSSLGDGQLTFASTTTFPDISGCFLSGLLTSLMSGPGQSVSFTAAPPAPVAW
jgi:hypothetical protein